MLKKFNNLNVAKKFLIVMGFVMFLATLSVVGLSYKMNSEVIIEAAGLELVGCANITLGLIEAKEVEKLKNGDFENLEQVESSLDWITLQKHIFDASYIIDEDGTLLALGKGMKERGYKVGQTYYIDNEAISKVSKKGEHNLNSYSSVYEFNDEKKQTGYAPIFNEEGEIIAYNGIDFDHSIIQERTFDLLFKTLLVVIVPIFLGMLVVYLFLRSTIKPLVELRTFTRKVAKGDLTEEPPTSENEDEIGKLKKDFGEMFFTIKTLITEVNKNSAQIKDTSDTIFVNSKEMSDVSSIIAGNIEEVSKGTDGQVESAINASEKVSKIKESAKNMNNDFGSIVEISNSTTKKSDNGNKVVTRVKEQMESINEKTEVVYNTINSLEIKTVEIEKIVDLINNISEQTNLLALNASIEAARAGEQGKGFAVVADEVRKLAEESSKSTEQISNLVREIHKETNKAVNAANEGKHSVFDGMKLVDEVSGTFNDISGSVFKVKEDVENFKNVINEINKDVEAISDSIERISEISNETQAKTEEVSAASEEQSASIQSFTIITNDLSNLAKNLNRLIDSFKI